MADPTQTGAAALGGPIQAQRTIGDFFPQQKGLGFSLSVDKPTTDTAAAQLYQIYQQVMSSNERVLPSGAKDRPMDMIWADVPKELRDVLQKKVGDEIKLNPNEPVSKALSQLAEKAGLDLAKSTATQALEWMKKELGTEATYALVGALATGAAIVLSKENPALLLKAANDAIPEFTVKQIRDDHFQATIKVDPKITNNLADLLTWNANFKASTQDFNFANKPPADGERLTVGGGTLEIHRKADGSLYATGQGGREIPIPAKDPKDPKETIDTRAEISKYLNSQMASNFRMGSPEQQAGIKSSELLPPVPAKDGATPVLSGEVKLNGNGQGIQGGSVSVKVDRAMGPESTGYSLGVNQGIGPGAKTQVVGSLDVPLKLGDQPSALIFRAKGDHTFDGPTKASLGVDIPSWKVNITAIDATLNSTLPNGREIKSAITYKPLEGLQIGASANWDTGEKRVEVRAGIKF
jgi:hypothetical protein